MTDPDTRHCFRFEVWLVHDDLDAVGELVQWGDLPPTRLDPAELVQIVGAVVRSPKWPPTDPCRVELYDLSAEDGSPPAAWSAHTGYGRGVGIPVDADPYVVHYYDGRA